jgi:hypothetical protein
MPMSVVRRAKRRRWTLVAVVAALLIAVPAVVATLPSAGPSIDPARLRALISESSRRPYQGYAESTGLIGLPDLPYLADVTSLLNGTTRMRTWYMSPDQYRVDVMTVSGERDLYRTPQGEITWDYDANLHTEFIGEPPVRLPRAADLLPPELARQVLAASAADPVDTLPVRRVAGISASGLRLRPADPDTTVGQVDIWADSVTGVPVRVEVTARGQAAPILVTAFSELDLSAPTVPIQPPTPPPGSDFDTVSAPDVTKILGVFSRSPLPLRVAGRELNSTNLGGVRGAGLYGSGLASFVVLAVPREIGAAATDAAGEAGAATLQLPGGTAVAQSIPPLSLMVVRSVVSRRSYLLAGLVTPAVLEAAAGQLSTLPRSGG